MGWYKVGTVNVTNNSSTVTGVGTAWVQAAALGETFLGPDGGLYEITAINSNTSLSISPAYKGPTSTAQNYALMPTQGYLRDLAAQAAALVNAYASVKDNAGQGKFAAGTVAAPSLRGVADENTGLNLPGGDVWQAVSGGTVRLQFAANGAVTGGSVGLGSGQLHAAGVSAPQTLPENGLDALPVNGFSGAMQTTEADAVAAGLPALGGASASVRSWSVLTLGTVSRRVQYATEVFDTPSGRGRTFVRVKHDAEWHPWRELYNSGTNPIGTEVGNLMQVGEFGIGVLSGNAQTNVDAVQPTGVYQVSSNAAGWPFSGTGGRLIALPVNANYSAQIAVASGAPVRMALRADTAANLPTAPWRTVYHTGNTSVDSNGFIKQASPIVNLYADKIEANDSLEVQPVQFERESTGVYMLTGCPPLSSDGWYLEQPRDRNGSVYHNVEWYYDAEARTLRVETFERVWNPVTGQHDNGDPVDIQSGRFIALRFAEDPSLYPVSDEESEVM